MRYAIGYINSVEYGRSQGHYAWSKKDRTEFTEAQLADALNKAYDAGRKSMAAEVRIIINKENHK